MNQEALFRKRRYTRHLVFTVIVLGTFLGAVVWQSSSSPSLRIEPVARHGVALIDELSLTYPDPYFVDELRSIVTRSGFWFEYYSPSDVVVPLFWALPALGYEAVIIRAHSTGWVPRDKITIFTGEKYEKGKYYLEQAKGLVSSASTFENDEQYFTVTPDFIGKASRGRFPGTLVVMMGCTGLRNGQLAGAFTGRGAAAYVGWLGQVEARRTDSATLSLLEALFQEHLPLNEAISYAMSKVGQDPVYKSELGLYPEAAATLKVELS